MIEWKPAAGNPNSQQAFVGEFELLVFPLAADPNQIGWELYGRSDQRPLLASGEADSADAAKAAAEEALSINDGSISDT